MSKKRRWGGFTLPEVLVTVTVVAVLAAVVVPSVTQYVTKGDAPATGQDITELRNAITAYVADTHTYPANLYALEVDPGVTGWKGPYTTAALATGATGSAATFTSSGEDITIGGGISSTALTGYLTTNVSLAGSNHTCQDLWNLDKVIDGSDASTSDAQTMAGTGTLQWSGACNVNGATGSGSAPTDDATGATVTLTLVAIGK